LRAAEGYQSNVCTLDFPTVLSVSKLIPRPPRPIIPRRTCSLASNGMPVMVEFAFFGSVGIEAGLRCQSRPAVPHRRSRRAV
jgi:hypothetical protein